jgi:adenosylhomocysteine nucleosidase
VKTLIVIPIQKELGFFLHTCAEHGLAAEDAPVGRLSATQYPDPGITLVLGGLGKVQCAVQTQHALDVGRDWDLVICAGAAGALVDELSVGDVVVGTETIEHDIHNHFGPPLLPRFSGAATIVASLSRVILPRSAFSVHLGPIASGDEDVVDGARREELYRLTGAVAVAWEGAGSARACRLSEVPFVEIRGITDGANSSAAADFATNLETAMRNVATLILTWLREPYG